MLFRSPRKAAFNWNQLGASVGGKIKQDRTFFFANYETIIRRSGVTQSPSVPDDLVRQGLIPDNSLAGGRRQVNVAPSVRPFLDLYPRVNGGAVGGSNSGVGAHFFSTPNPINEHYWVGRVDHQINSKQSLF